MKHTLFLYYFVCGSITVSIQYSSYGLMGLVFYYDPIGFFVLDYEMEFLIFILVFLVEGVIDS